MARKFVVALAALVVLTGPARGQDARSVLESAAREMGAAGLRSIAYTGSGRIYLLGQSIHPDSAWPRFNLTGYSRTIDYEGMASREEVARTQYYGTPRGGGVQPVVGEQRTVQLVSGDRAWNLTGETATPALAAAAERRLGIWTTPHGFLKAAASRNPTATTRTAGGKRVTVVSFMEGGRRVQGHINAQNQVEKVESWIDNPVLGDMLVETAYSDYRDHNGTKFPARIVQRQGGRPVLEIDVTGVQPNAAASITVPQNVRTATAGPLAPIRVESTRMADGVWYLAGGSHHSVAVEFGDHVVVVEAPLNEDRSMAVIREVGRVIPGKPIRYLVNTHHHFDHSGGLRTFAAEGATIVTHAMNRLFYERAFRAPRTLMVDRLAASGATPRFRTLTDRLVLGDATRTLEIHHLRGNTHNQGVVVAYLPKEKILIEADVFTPPAPNTPAPATPNPFTVNLHDNIRRLKLDVEQIAPLHGRIVPLAEMLRMIGRTP